MSDSPITRRTALVGGVAGASMLTLAACGTSSGSTTTPAPPQPPEGSTPSDSSDSLPSSGTSASAGASGALAKLDSITVGEAVSANLSGKPVLVSRPTATTAVCFSAICTHQGCTVGPAGKQLQCPCHGSIYNATTGAVISGLAPRALDTIAVRVEHGEIVADA